MATWQDTITADTRTQGGVTALIAKAHEAMIAVGCVQTDDTGQLDLDSYPPIVSGATTNHGYRIYELNDSQSAEEPIYIKLEFVTKRNGNVDCLMLETWVTVGFETDGLGQVSHPRAVANTPYTGYSAGSGLVPVVTTNAPCYACKVDGWLFVLVGCGYFTRSGSSSDIFGTATFFAVSRTPRGAVLYHSNLSSPGGASNMTELAHSVVDRVASSSVGPNTHTLPASALGVVNGEVVAVPALVCGVHSVWTDENVVSVLRTAVTMGSTVELSTNDVTDTTYMVIPAPSAANRAGLTGRNPVVADSREFYNRAIAMRFE